MFYIKNFKRKVASKVPQLTFVLNTGAYLEMCGNIADI